MRKIALLAVLVLGGCQFLESPPAPPPQAVIDFRDGLVALEAGEPIDARVLAAATLFLELSESGTLEVGDDVVDVARLIVDAGAGETVDLPPAADVAVEAIDGWVRLSESEGGWMAWLETLVTVLGAVYAGTNVFSGRAWSIVGALLKAAAPWVNGGIELKKIGASALALTGSRHSGDLLQPVEGAEPNA